MKKIPKMCAKPKKAVKGLTLSQIDFNEEVSFAKRFVKNEVSLDQYPYIESYRKTIEAEKVYLSANTLVVGCGPFPLSMILLGGVTDGLDSSEKAVNLANAVTGAIVPCFGTDVFHEKAEIYKDYGIYDSILVTLEAGDSQEKKQAILDNIWSRIDSYTTVVVRSSNTDEFISVQLDSDDWDVVDKLSVFDGLSTSYILRQSGKVGKKRRNIIYKKLLKVVCADPKVNQGLCYYLHDSFDLDICDLPELDAHDPNADGDWIFTKNYQHYWAPRTYEGWETRIGWIVQAIKDTE